MPIFSLDLSNRSMVSDFPDAHPTLPHTSPNFNNGVPCDWQILLYTSS